MSTQSMIDQMAASMMGDGSAGDFPYWRSKAIDALKSIREPNQDVREAAAMSLWNKRNAHASLQPLSTGAAYPDFHTLDGKYRLKLRTECLRPWRSMIDAILEGK